MSLGVLSVEVTRALSRMITGNLLADDQIRSITSTVVGRYFADWFAPTEEQVRSEHQVESARHHIEEAQRIIAQLTTELEGQADQLSVLEKEIEDKGQLANRYSAMATAGEEAVAAFRQQFEETVRNELRTQANKGRNVRRLASGIIWLITLILGAALGAYFPQIVAWFGAS